MFDAQLDRIPLEPPRSISLLPGLWLRSAYSKALIVPVVFAVFLIVMACFVVFQEPGARLAVLRSETTSGTVVVRTVRDDCTERGGKITYTFRPHGGPEFRGSQSVREESPYAKVGPGDPIPVRYLVSDPSLNVIAGDGNGDASWLIPVVMFPLFGLLFLGPFVLPLVGTMLKDRRLFRTGRITTGTVLFVKQSASLTWPGWPGWGVANVFVTFQLREGETAEAIATCRNEWLLRHLAPGTAVRIAYRPEKPGKALLLEAYVR